VLRCERNHADGNWEPSEYRDGSAGSHEPHCFRSSGQRVPLGKRAGSGPLMKRFERRKCCGSPSLQGTAGSAVMLLVPLERWK
jgi:hypothetical protein